MNATHNNINNKKNALVEGNARQEDIDGYRALSAEEYFRKISKVGHTTSLTLALSSSKLDPLNFLSQLGFPYYAAGSNVLSRRGGRPAGKPRIQKRFSLILQGHTDERGAL